MSDKTPRFGLSFYGGAVPGSLTDDGNAFTLRDPVATDRILAALEGHEHTGTGAGAQVPDPAGLPSATLLTGGTIEAGQTLYYVVTFVDRFGLETAAGDEIAIETGEVILAPSSPDAETGPGGSLTPGLYYYALTALDGADETTLSPPEMATVIEGEGSVTLNLPDVPDGADSLRVWRQGPGEGTFSRLDVATDVTFLDDGSIPPDPCPWDPAHQPPSENTTRTDGAVQVELAPEDAAVVNDRSRRIASWRLYRTSVSGTYAASSLVTEMTSHVDVDPDSDLVTVYVDDGAALQAGSPPPVSQTLREPSSIALPTAAVLPADTTGYPANYPLLVGDQLYVSNGTAWVLVAGGGGGGGGAADPQSGFGDTVLTQASDGTRYRMVAVGGALTAVPTVLPGPPSALVVGFDDPELSWAAPAYDGGLPLLGFTVWLLMSDGSRTLQDVATDVYTFDALELFSTGTGWIWVTARNDQGHSAVDEGSIYALDDTGGGGGVIGPAFWSMDTAEDLFGQGPTTDPVDARQSFNTYDPAQPTGPTWNDPSGTLHPTAGLRANYWRYRPAQDVTLTLSVSTDGPPSAGNWYVDLLSKVRDGSPVTYPDDSVIWQETLFTGDTSASSATGLTADLVAGNDYYFVVSWPEADASGTIVITDGGYDWSDLASPQVTTLAQPIGWHNRQAQVGFGGWVMFDDVVDTVGNFSLAFEVFDGTTVTCTLYNFSGGGYPSNPAALNELEVLFTDQTANATFDRSLPNGPVWLHLEQAGPGAGTLTISAG